MQRISDILQAAMEFFVKVFINAIKVFLRNFSFQKTNLYAYMNKKLAFFLIGSWLTYSHVPYMLNSFLYSFIIIQL